MTNTYLIAHGSKAVQAARIIAAVNRPTVAEQQCGAEEKLRMVRDVVTTWNDCAWVTDRDALVAILSIVGDNNQP